MHSLFERWYVFSSSTRILSWGLISGSVLLTAYLMLARPAIRHVSQLEMKREHIATVVKALWASEAHRGLAEGQPDSSARQAFSPLDFQTHGVRLVRWLPSAKGGELSLDADWMQIPALFEAIAQRGMGVTAFSVEPGESRLKLIVQVESLHAN
ncbi:HofO family protein [Lelliottia amnigena]